MRVELLRDLDPYAEARRRLRGEPEPIVDRASTDASGMFTLEAPEPGLYRVRTTAPGRIPSGGQLELVESIELGRFEFFESADPVVLRVLDADGKPIVSPRVSEVVDRDRRNWDQTGRPWAFATWAEAAIEVYAARDSKATLEISVPGHEPRRVAVASLGQPVRLARRAGADERSLVVVDESGSPLAEAMVVDEEANPIAETSGDGVARCLLAPGETVHLLVADGRSAMWTASEAAEARVVFVAAPAITGIVMGDDGRPLAGAWVGATARPNGGERAMMLTPRAVTTDTAGRYTLPVERDTELEVWAVAPGHLREWRETRVTAATPRRTLDFNLGSSATLEGLVVAGAGLPVAGAELEIESRGALATRSWRHIANLHGRSREGGRFSIALPPSALFAFDTRADGFAPHRTEVQSPAARERSNVVITLGRGASLAGRAVDESGTPIPGATASLEVSPANDRSSSGSNERPQTVTATDDGRFAFALLPAGFYDLAVTAPGHSANRRPGIAVGAAAVDLGDVGLGQGETLTGRVVDQDGSPIAGAVVIGTASKPGDRASLRSSMMLIRHEELDESEGPRTDAEGRFTLTDLSAGQAIDLYADAPGYGLGRAGRFVMPVEEEIEIRLRRGGSLAGRVVDRQGEPIVARLEIERGTRSLGFTTAGERSSVRGSTDIDGRFTVEDLAPGDWQLEVRAPRYDSDSQSVAVAAGERTGIEDVVLDREETAEVHGTVTDARGIGVSATVRWLGNRSGREAQTDSTGAYHLPSVPLGEGKLSARRITGGAERIVEVVVVEGDNTFDFTLDGATLEGRAIDLEGNGIAGVELLLHNESSAAYTSTGLDGSFVIHDLAPGRYWTRATKAGLTPREQLILDLGPEGESGIEIVMTKGAIIRGRILGVPERELAEVSVMAFGVGEATARVLADGTYRVDGVAAGPWTIAGHTGDFRDVRKTVTVAPDQSVATLDLDFSGPRFNVKGRVAGPDGPIQDGTVTIRNVSDGPDARTSHSWTDHEGAFLFGPLPPGQYVIEVYAGSRRAVPAVTKAVTIEENTEVLLITSPPP